MSLAVPIILCGKVEAMAKGVIERVGPEYDVVHSINSVDAGKSELPKLLAGEAIRPSSGLGSNAKNASIAMSGKAPRPRAVVVGRGFSDDEFAELRAVAGAASVPWLKPDDGFSQPGVERKLMPDWIGDRIKNALSEHGIVPGSEDGPSDGTVWGY